MYEEIEVPITFPVNLEEKMVLTQNFMLPITKKKKLKINFCVYKYFLLNFLESSSAYISTHTILNLVQFRKHVIKKSFFTNNRWSIKKKKGRKASRQLWNLY